MASTLTAKGISVQFGGLKVIDNVDLVVNRSEILGLIGPNGAGKTTFVNVLSGFQMPGSGSVSVGTTDITRSRPDDRARHGLVRTFQAVRLFAGLTVAENIEAAALAGGLTRKDARRRVNDLMEELHLGDWADVLARALPYGIERRVGMARALIARPHFILLDEPAAGLDEREAFEFLSFATTVRNSGCGILLIEHNMRLVFELCDRVQVLQTGRTLAVGTPDEIRANPQVRAAYLGSHAA